MQCSSQEDHLCLMVPQKNQLEYAKSGEDSCFPTLEYNIDSRKTIQIRTRNRLECPTTKHCKQWRHSTANNKLVMEKSGRGGKRFFTLGYNGESQWHRRFPHSSDQSFLVEMVIADFRTYPKKYFEE